VKVYSLNNARIAAVRHKYIFFGIIIISFLSLLQPFIFLIRSEKATGTVVRNFYEGNSKRSIIQYKIGKEIYEFTSEENIYYEIGTKVSVVFIPSKPHKVKVNSFSGIWINTLIYVFFACSFWAAFILSISKNMLNHLFDFKTKQKQLKQNE